MMVMWCASRDTPTPPCKLPVRTSGGAPKKNQMFESSGDICGGMLLTAFVREVDQQLCLGFPVVPARAQARVQAQPKAHAHVR